MLGRLGALAEGVTLPFALQGLYLIAYRFTSGLGSGRPTTFSYAYLIAALLVAVTATSIALVSSVPLARGELTAAGAAARHVVAASWLSLALIGGAAGVFALAGGRVAQVALGSQYGGETGSELGRLVAYFAPWMVVSVAVSVTFPLLFVRGRGRWLPAARARGARTPGARRVGLPGAARPCRARGGHGPDDGRGARGAARGPRRPARRAARPRRRLPCCSRSSRPSASARRAPWSAPAPGGRPRGLVLYAAAVAVWRPRGLRDAWRYLHGLA